MPVATHRRPPMENKMREDHEITFENLDYRTLSPDERIRVQREAMRRAHEERAQTIARMFGRLMSWRRAPRRGAPETDRPMRVSAVPACRHV